MGKTEVFDPGRNGEVEQEKKALPREEAVPVRFLVTCALYSFRFTDLIFPPPRKCSYRNRSIQKNRRRFSSSARHGRRLLSPWNNRDGIRRASGYGMHVFDIRFTHGTNPGRPGLTDSTTTAASSRPPVLDANICADPLVASEHIPGITHGHEP